MRSANLDTTGLVEEANLDYSRSMNQIVFDISLKRPEQANPNPNPNPDWLISGEYSTYMYTREAQRIIEVP